MQQLNNSNNQNASIEANRSLKDDSPLRQQNHQTNWGYFILFSYSYFLQGIINGIGSTMPYIYAQLPSIDTMTIFNANALPFSFKFLVAPFLQKFSCIEYGKRKTWMMIGYLGGTATLFVSAFFTDMKYANLFAILAFLTQSWMVLLDVSTHALMVKELNSVAKSSIILCFAQTAGGVFSGLIILKLTSKEFAEILGLENAISSPKVIIICFALFNIIPLLYMNFRLKETVLQSERQGSKFSFFQMIYEYKVFLKPSSRYFRLCIYFLIYLQGFNFFDSLYAYKLVQKGFSRDVSNTISNIVLIPVIFFTFQFPMWTDCMRGKANTIMLTFIVTILSDIVILIWFPLQVWIIATSVFISTVVSSWYFFIAVSFINEFPVHALTGMFIAMTASISNLGQNTSLHTQIVGKLGWQLCAWIGMGYQVLIVVFQHKIVDWIYQGDTHLSPELEEHNMQLKQKQQLDEGEHH